MNNADTADRAMQPEKEGRVQIATTDADKEEIYRLRYEVYIQEMGGAERHGEADVAQRQLRDEMDETACHLYVRQRGEIVACIRNNLRRDGPFECEHLFGLERFAPAFPDHVSMTSRLAIHPKIRGGSMMKELACFAFRYLRRDDGSRFDFIDCHPRLIPLYSRLGYRIYDYGFRHPKYVYVVPMVLVATDIEYLEKIKSPLAPIAAEFPHTNEDRDFLLSRFPDAKGEVSADINDQQLWQMLREQLADPGTNVDRISWFSELTPDQITLLGTLGNIVRCRAGDTVVVKGDTGREVFMVLSGCFGVRASQKEDWLYQPLMAGDMFGEISFLTNGMRSAPVVATEESTVLVLNARALDRLVAIEPSLAATLYQNLGTMIAARMREGLFF